MSLPFQQDTAMWDGYHDGLDGKEFNSPEGNHMSAFWYEKGYNDGVSVREDLDDEAL